jgi:hypothetical protein
MQARTPNDIYAVPSAVTGRPGEFIIVVPRLISYFTDNMSGRIMDRFYAHVSA